MTTCLDKAVTLAPPTHRWGERVWGEPFEIENGCGWGYIWKQVCKDCGEVRRGIKTHTEYGLPQELFGKYVLQNVGFPTPMSLKRRHR